MLHLISSCSKNLTVQGRTSKRYTRLYQSSSNALYRGIRKMDGGNTHLHCWFLRHIPETRHVFQSARGTDHLPSQPFGWYHSQSTYRHQRARASLDVVLQISKITGSGDDAIDGEVIGGYIESVDKRTQQLIVQNLVIMLQLTFAGQNHRIKGYSMCAGTKRLIRRSNRDYNL